MKSAEPSMEELIESWEKQQNCHIRFREDRFNIMFDYIEQACGTGANALDIACGPGSLSRRFLDRFPESTITSVDYDPVLLYIGKSALSHFSDRMNWVEGDLRAADWTAELKNNGYDCAMSTTALHWLGEQEVAGLYRNIYSMLREGGVFLNGDHLISETRQEKVLDLVHKAREKWSENAFRSTGSKDWDAWWGFIRNTRLFSNMLEERSRRYSNPDNHNKMVSLQTHVAYLQSAGFSRVDVIWQYGNDRILVAMK